MNLSDMTNIDHYTTIDSTAASSSQFTMPKPSDQLSYWGFVWVLVMVMGFCAGRWSLKLQKRKVLSRRQQQIQSLERIWKMSARQKY